MKKLLLIPITVVTALLALAFLQPSTAGGVVRAIAPTLLAAIPSTISQGNGSGQEAQANNGGSGSSGQGSGQASSPSGSTGSTGSTGALSNPSDAQVNPESKIDTVHQVSTAGHVNCGRFGGGYHGGKHLFVCPNPPYPPPAQH